jgi:hypothetical protein
MLGTGESLAELNEVSGRLGDELLTTVWGVGSLLNVHGVSCLSRDTPKELYFVDECCCSEMVAFWKKRNPQVIQMWSISNYERSIYMPHSADHNLTHPPPPLSLSLTHTHTHKPY